MRCPCKPSCQGPCAVEVLKTAMFSQPKRPEGSAKQQGNNNADAFTTIQHLEMLFKEHHASDILRSGFNDALVSQIINLTFFSLLRTCHVQAVSSCRILVCLLFSYALRICLFHTFTFPLLTHYPLVGLSCIFLRNLILLVG